MNSVTPVEEIIPFCQSNKIKTISYNLCAPKQGLSSSRQAVAIQSKFCCHRTVT